jgi:hypothetical protein
VLRAPLGCKDCRVQQARPARRAQRGLLETLAQRALQERMGPPEQREQPVFRAPLDQLELPGQAVRRAPLGQQDLQAPRDHKARQELLALAQQDRLARVHRRTA